MSEEIVKISELTAVSDLLDGCCFPLVQNSATRKITYASLVNNLQDDLEFPEAKAPTFSVDAVGHLWVEYADGTSSDLGRVKGYDGETVSPITDSEIDTILNS